MDNLKMFLLLLISTTSATNWPVELEQHEKLPQMKVQQKDIQLQQMDNIGLTYVEKLKTNLQKLRNIHSIKKRSEIKVVFANRQIGDKNLIHVPETKNDKVDRRQDMFVDGQVIYVQPSLLKEPFIHLKNVDKQIDTLKDLIGKNPNIQLEGLQNFLQNSPQGLRITSAINKPQPFQVQRSNNMIPPEYPKKTHINLTELANANAHAPVSQHNLLSIQQQLDEAAKKQAEEALERAQKQAQAHVEAQHKAIAEAQKAIFAKFQNSIYQTPQALPLVQEQLKTIRVSDPLPEPMPVPDNTITTEQHNHNIISQNLHPIRDNGIHRQHLNNKVILPERFNSVALTTPASIVVTQPVKPQFDQSIKAENIQWQSLESPPIPVTVAPPLHLKQSNIVAIESPNISKLNPPKADLTAQNFNIYAPNHIHESVAQQQAKKAIIDQVRYNNKQILKAHKLASSTSAYSPELSKETLKNTEATDARETQATAYEEIVFKPEYHNEIPHSHTKSTSGEGFEDDKEHYASKYAFGYQIKDMKEGNEYGHEEKRQGKIAHGSYHVLLPDGRRQTVEYYVDDGGYHAKVTYRKVADDGR